MQLSSIHPQPFIILAGPAELTKEHTNTQNAGGAHGIPVAMTSSANNLPLIPLSSPLPPPRLSTATVRGILVTGMLQLLVGSPVFFVSEN